MCYSGLVDSHLHLQDFDPCVNIKTLIEQTLNAGVSHLVCNGESPADWPAVYGIAKQFPQVVPCYGLHPWFVRQESNNWVSILEDLIALNQCGIGETGLDRRNNKTELSLQVEAFRIHLALARKYNRPIMLHCVRAWGLLIDVLKGEQGLSQGLLIHAYAGSVDLIKPLSDMGAYFSFSGKVLYENYERSRLALAAMPLDRLLIESDAPNMLPPESYRLQPIVSSDGADCNHPANLPAILVGISDFLKISPETLRHQLWQNSKIFFGSITNF